MHEVWGMAALWLGLALVATLLSTLLMSTGLTFGSISALFGLTHGIISR